MSQLKPSCVKRDAQSKCATAQPQPSLMPAVAANLHRVLPLDRDEHLAIWKRVVKLYAQANRPVSDFMRCLSDESFVENLLHDEVFWGLTGDSVSREPYATAATHLTAVYATAALLSARQDHLPLAAEDLARFDDKGITSNIPKRVSGQD